jgi:F0F1-type ATP synthase assembly protein I
VGQNNKVVIYKNMLLASTFAGVFGAYFLYKGFKTLAWVLIGVWAVVGIVVRVLIIDRKSSKNRKEI